MDNVSHSSASRGDSNIANLGAGAQVKQFAQGNNITQIEGYTAEQVRVLIADIRASYQRKPFDGRSPYVGLASFQERDADRFFGREKLTAQLVTRIETTRFLVIAGPSGSGKSSLARAGLMHTLRRGVQLNAPTNISTGSENWLYEILTPGRNPLSDLARVVSSFTGKLQTGDEIVQRGRADETLLHRWADIALGDQKTRRAIFLVDQFEEIFTQVTDESERAAFLNLLVYAAAAENGRVTIVCCTRSDFIGNWVKYPNLNDLLRHGLYQIPPMQPDELVSAIARPAIQVGLPIDETLVKEILDDMRAAPGALPLMQFALQDLFEYEKSKGSLIALTRDDYLARGGLHQALSRHADAAFAKLNADEQKIARSVFASLIEPGRGNVDTRRTARLQEIVPAGADAAQVKNVITKLADARLVTTDKSDADETITLAHERLIDAWKWLRDLIDENREAIALQNQINDDAKEWEQQGRDASYLYTGARLATAQEEVEKKKIVLSAVAEDFVDVAVWTREEAKRQETKRTRRLIIAFGTAAVIFAVLAVFAFSRQFEAEHQQRIARSRELAALALSQFDTNPDLGMLIAIEANQDAEAVTFESEDALRQLLTKYPLEFALRGHTEWVSDAQFSPDGRKIVTAEYEGIVRVWDATTGKQLDTMEGNSDRVSSAIYSADGKQILTASADGIKVWDAEHKSEQVNITAHPGGILSIQFSPDGKKILSTGCDKYYGHCLASTTRLWDATNGAALGVLHPRQNSIATGQFSPDGKFIVTAGCDQQTQDACEKTSVRLWDAVGEQQLAVLDGQSVFTAATFSPDGNKLLTIGCASPNQSSNACLVDSLAQVWDVNALIATPENAGPIILRLPNLQIENARFAPDSNKVVFADSDRTARVWEIGSSKAPLVLPHEQGVSDALISPDGDKILTIEGSLARLWDTNGNPLTSLRGHEGSILRAGFSADGNKILTASADGTARLWDISAPQAAANGRELALLNGHTGSVRSAQFSPDRKEIVTASYDKTARLWDAANFAEIHVLRGHEEPVLSAEFSTDGKKIVTASYDNTVRIWDTVNGNGLGVLRADELFGVNHAQFSFDGKKIVTANGDETARVWDVASLLETGKNKELATLLGHKFVVQSAEFSQDGSKIVTASWDATARIWDATSGHELTRLQGSNDPVNNAQFSSDGKQVLTASTDGTSRIWDTTTGKQLIVLRGHNGAVTNARFSPDGNMVVTASADHTARIWDPTNRRELAVLRGHASEVWDAEFSPDGTEIITSGGDGTARIFLVHVRDLVKLAHTRIGRELTCQEREQYLNEENVCPTPTPEATLTP